MRREAERFGRIKGTRKEFSAIEKTGRKQGGARDILQIRARQTSEIN
jgi:hypothetical protein